MAQRFHHFKVTAGKGGGPAFFESFRTDFPAGEVVGFQVVIPSGHNNLTGLRITYGNGQVIPKAEDTWLTGNHKTFEFELEDPMPGGIGWFSDVYNSDRMYDHSFQVTVEVVDLEDLLGTLPPVVLLRQRGGGATVGGELEPTDGGTGGGGRVPV